MGRLYSQIAFDVKDPATYLLSNGAEEKKGSPLVKEANVLFRETNFPNFKGNIEHVGSIVNVKIIEAKTWFLLGEEVA